MTHKNLDVKDEAYHHGYDDAMEGFSPNYNEDESSEEYMSGYNDAIYDKMIGID